MAGKNRNTVARNVFKETLNSSARTFKGERVTLQGYDCRKDRRSFSTEPWDS
jgi:hypothetical protein